MAKHPMDHARRAVAPVRRNPQRTPVCRVRPSGIATGRSARLSLLGLVAVLTITLAGCSASTSGAAAGPSASPKGALASPTSDRPSVPALSGNVVVFAAASLTKTFTDLAHSFESAHPGVHVQLSFGGSPTLAQQIEQGAPADVFASADQAVMAQAVKAAAIAGTPQTFATNVLEIAVPVGNPGHVTSLAAFADPSLRIAVCAVQVPCGAASAKVFAVAGITPRPDTLEQDVTAVLTKVELGEVDAGLVYRTDVAVAGAKVLGIPFPQSGAAVNIYPIAQVAHAPNPAAAVAFIDYVRGPIGRQALAQAGFGSP